MFKTAGYEHGHSGRDLIAEAARILDGSTMMQPERAHLAAVLETCAEALALILEDYDSLDDTARDLGRGSHHHELLSGHGRALLARLTGDQPADFLPRTRGEMPPPPIDPRD